MPQTSETASFTASPVGSATNVPTEHVPAEVVSVTPDVAPPFEEGSSATSIHHGPVNRLDQLISLAVEGDLQKTLNTRRLKVTNGKGVGLLPLLDALTELPFADGEIGLLKRSQGAAEESLQRARDRGVLNLVEGPQEVVDLSNLEIVCGVLTGESHLAEGRIAQDAGEKFIGDLPGSDGVKFAIVGWGDGVSTVQIPRFPEGREQSFNTKSHNEHGAALISNAAICAAYELLPRHNGDPLDPKFLGELYARVYRDLSSAAMKMKLHPNDALMVLSSTLQLTVITPTITVVLGLGDGFFQDGDKYTALEPSDRRIEVKSRDNVPALMARCLADDCDAALNLWASEAVPVIRNGTIPPRDFKFHEETKAFEIMFAVPTAALVKNGIRLYSDGAVYTTEQLYKDQQEVETAKGKKPADHDFFFPLERLVDKFPPETIEIAAASYNLVVQALPREPAAKAIPSLVPHLYELFRLGDKALWTPVSTMVAPDLREHFEDEFSLDEKFCGVLEKQNIEILLRFIDKPFEYNEEIAALGEAVKKVLFEKLVEDFDGDPAWCGKLEKLNFAAINRYLIKDVPQSDKAPAQMKALAEWYSNIIETIKERAQLLIVQTVRKRGLEILNAEYGLDLSKCKSPCLVHDDLFWARVSFKKSEAAAT